MELSPKERFEAAIAGEEVDRPPVGYLYFGGGGAVLRELGASFRDVYYTAEGMARAQLKARELFGHDNLMAPWGCMAVEAEAFGCDLLVKEDGYPRVMEPILKDGGIKDLAMPDPERDGRMPTVLESIGILRDETGGEVPVIGAVCSPFIVAYQLRGFTEFLLDVVEKPREAHALLEIATEASLGYIEAMVDEGAFGVLIEDSGAGAECIDPLMCEEFITSYTRRLVDGIKAAGAYAFVRNGSPMPYMEKEISLLPDVLSLDWGDLDAIRSAHCWDCKTNHARIGACQMRYCISETEGPCLMGNIDHTKVMVSAFYEEVYKEAMACLRSAARRRKGGFILSTGGEAPFATPPENMRALADAARDFARVPRLWPEVGHRRV